MSSTDSNPDSNAAKMPSLAEGASKMDFLVYQAKMQAYVTKILQISSKGGCRSVLSIHDWWSSNGTDHEPVTCALGYFSWLGYILSEEYQATLE